MSGPRLLYVPIAAALEADRTSGLIDWAEVETFDAPGAGANSDAESRGVRGVMEAAVARLDDLGWDRCGVVCDSTARPLESTLPCTIPTA